MRAPIVLGKNEPVRFAHIDESVPCFTMAAESTGSETLPPPPRSPPPPPSDRASKLRRLGVMRQMVEITQSEDLEQLSAYTEFIRDYLEKIYGDEADTRR